jgi:hypothetical protein
MLCIQKDFENASHEAKSDAFDEFFLHLRLKDKVHGCEIYLRLKDKVHSYEIFKIFVSMMVCIKRKHVLN